MLYKLLNLLLLSTFLSADQYIISYRSVIKNSMLYSEKLSVSKSMKECAGYYDKAFIIFGTKTDTLNSFLQNNITDFVENIMPYYLELKNSEKTQNLINSNLTTLRLEPTCFEVQINDNFVKLTRIKQ